MKPTQFPGYVIIFCAVALLLTACNARRKTSLFNSPTDYVMDTIKHVYVVNDQGLGDYYRLKPEDRIILKNLQDDEFLGEAKAKTNINNSTLASDLQSFEVDNMGFVTLPAVGKVYVAGLNRKEVTKKMQEVFEKLQTKNAIIEVTIINLKVTLLGEFAKPGNYMLERDNISLIEILAEAGGPLPTADPKTLKIIRGDRANPEQIYVNLNDIASIGSKKLILQNNDIITIQQQKVIATTNKLQSLNNFLQPILVLLNLGLLILTITK